MIAAIDALIPPLDRHLGFFLLLAVGAGLVLGWLFDRARREAAPAEPDPHAAPYGDVPEVRR